MQQGQYEVEPWMSSSTREFLDQVNDGETSRFIIKALLFSIQVDESNWRAVRRPELATDAEKCWRALANIYGIRATVA